MVELAERFLTSVIPPAEPTVDVVAAMVFESATDRPCSIPS